GPSGACPRCRPGSRAPRAARASSRVPRESLRSARRVRRAGAGPRSARAAPRARARSPRPAGAAPRSGGAPRRRQRAPRRRPATRAPPLAPRRVVRRASKFARVEEIAAAVLRPRRFVMAFGFRLLLAKAHGFDLLFPDAHQHHHALDRLRAALAERE